MVDDLCISFVVAWLVIAAHSFVVAWFAQIQLTNQALQL
jgi:hypothetical protein